MVRTRLLSILEERDMSIRELSRRIGCRFDSLRMLANDEMRRFPNDLLFNICDELRISIGELLYLDAESTTKNNQK